MLRENAFQGVQRGLHFRQVIGLTRPLAKAAGKVDARDVLWPGPCMHDFVDFVGAHQVIKIYLKVLRCFELYSG